MSGFEPFLFGAAATGAGTATATAATSGLLGAGGAFGLGQTLATVGGLTGALGAYQNGQAQSQAANYNAAAAASEAASRERAQREEAERRRGSIVAQLGKSGATVAGTPLMVLAESAANAEIDALNTRYGGAMQQSLYGATGRNARRAGAIGAGASLLTGYGLTR